MSTWTGTQTISSPRNMSLQVGRSLSFFPSITTLVLSRSYLSVDPLLYDSLVRQFFSPAERQAEGQEKGYSRTLESSLLRGEARLAKLASTQEVDENHGEGNGDSHGSPLQAPALGVQTSVTTDFEIDVAMAPPATTKEEGRELWEEFLRDRFVRGGDEDFEYRIVDENDELDALERKDREEEWFDNETPDWATPGAEGEEQQQQPQRDEEKGGTRPERILHGETGVQDF